mmetsp:Transcript_92874/g.262269  ORF Transcript_92874/g.262269 Transcript_92874/m.262269 type:complete len:995 (+) Transcript_92874:67-3051(+)
MAYSDSDAEPFQAGRRQFSSMYTLSVGLIAIGAVLLFSGTIGAFVTRGGEDSSRDAPAPASDGLDVEGPGAILTRGGNADFSSDFDACNAVLTADAGGSTCGARIKWLKDHQHKSDAQAKAQIAAEYEVACGACAPGPTPSPTPYTSCEAALNAFAGRYTCGSRIEYAKKLGRSTAEARAQIAEEFPDPCGVCMPEPTLAPTPWPTRADGLVGMYQSLAGVASDEGEGIGELKGSVAECFRACDADADCKSFSYCGGTCYFKKALLTADSPHVAHDSCSSWFRNDNEVNSSSKCPMRHRNPEPPELVLDYRGVAWPAMCFTGTTEEHIFLIGDWGGLPGWNGGIPNTADNTKSEAHPRRYWTGTDSHSQSLVADHMNAHAKTLNPRYVLNVGDSFYWGGLRGTCGKPLHPLSVNVNVQINPVFENVYKGPGMDGKPWFSVLGNHDYGGFSFNTGWDQQIAYTYGGSPSGRWLLPSQYWHQHVDYLTKNFSVDYYMIDTQVFDAKHPYHDQGHNICSREHNGHRADCTPYGPGDPWDCQKWFRKLWKQQMLWLDKRLNESAADWQIVLSHFPPQGSWGTREWKALASKYGIDLFVAGHTHRQEVHQWGDAHMPFVITGGGGGVTSETNPYSWGGKDQYGFMDMTISKESARIEAINQFGELRRTMTVKPRDGWWQKHRREAEAAKKDGTNIEMVFQAPDDTFAELDLDNPHKNMEPVCDLDSMGDADDNNETGCDDTFHGAQVQGSLTMHVSDQEAFLSDDSTREVTLVIARLGDIEEPRDVTVSLALAHADNVMVGRRLSAGFVDANFSVEVPAKELVETVGAALHSKAFAAINAELARSALLRAHGAIATGMWIDGFTARKPSDIVIPVESGRASFSTTVIILYGAVPLVALGVCVLVSLAVCTQRMHMSGSSKRSLTAKKAVPIAVPDSDDEAPLPRVSWPVQPATGNAAQLLAPAGLSAPQLAMPTLSAPTALPATATAMPTYHLVQHSAY